MGKGQQGPEEEIADLKSQVAKLTAENAQLKKQVAAFQAKEGGAKGEGKKPKAAAQPAPRSSKKEEQPPPQPQQPPQPAAPKEGASKRKPKSKKNKEDAELDRLLDDFRTKAETKSQANKAADSSPKKAGGEEANGQKRTRVNQFKNKKEEKLQKGNEEAIKQLQLKHMFSKLNDIMKDGDKNGKGAEGLMPSSLVPPSDDSDQ